jgi:hypothetical protein
MSQTLKAGAKIKYVAPFMQVFFEKNFDPPLRL